MTAEVPAAGAVMQDEHHVLRYIAPRHIDDGVVNGEGFLRRPAEDASSVSWLEYFDPPNEAQVAGVRAKARLTYAKTGQLVRLNVGSTRSYVERESPNRLRLQFVHDPLRAEGDHQEDPSHALIVGVPIQDSAEGDLIKDLLADCIIPPTYPTREAT